MNEWRVTGILKRDAEIIKVDGNPLLVFTIVHTKKVLGSRGQELTITHFIDCQMHDPDEEWLGSLKRGALLLVTGEAFLRSFTRKDGTQDKAMGNIVTAFTFMTPAPHLTHKGQSGLQ